MFGSKLPSAKKFKHWVTSEVLPAIRRTGGYSPAIPKDYPTALRAYADEYEKRMQVEQENRLLISENEAMRPKAEFFDELVDRKLLVNFRDAAKTLGVKQSIFIKFLLDRNYIYYDKHNQIRPYADKNKGLFELKPYTSMYSDHTGEQTMITPRGLETFRLLLKNIA